MSDESEKEKAIEECCEASEITLTKWRGLKNEENFFEVTRIVNTNPAHVGLKLDQEEAVYLYRQSGAYFEVKVERF